MINDNLLREFVDRGQFGAEPYKRDPTGQIDWLAKSNRDRLAVQVREAQREIAELSEQVRKVRRQLAILDAVAGR